MSSPSPDALYNPGLVDVVHRKCGGPRVASGSWRPPPAGGMRPSCLMHWCLTSWPGRFHLSDVPFIPGPLSPPILHPIALQWFEWAERALFKTKENQKTKSKQKKTLGSTQIPLFVLSKCHLPSPDVQRSPGVVDVVHRVSGRSRIVLRSRGTAVGRRCWNQAECTEG